jgi:primary-amine oxidase
LAAPPVTTSPLAPLTGDEIVAAVSAVREARELGERVRFVSVELREPSKEALAAGTPPREAFLVILTNDDGMTHEAVVSLDEHRLVDWRDLPGVHPAIHIDEFDDAGNAIVADPRFREALAKRGIENPDMVMVDPWSIGCFEDGERRLARGLAWLRADLDGDNGYSRPIGGLVGVVDLNTMEVVRIDDHGVLPVPSGEGGDYRPGAISPPRADIRAYEITQPDGPSFTLDGHRLAWQGWTLDVGFSPREGLVLHRIAYADRPVCHRASIAELVIPYGDPNPTVAFKNAFDIGEYGLGPLVNALELGCDCLGEIRYLDAWVNDSRGGAVHLPNAICIHEEDIGILWKHFDYRSGRTDVTRARRLVVSCIATVGNYEYGFYWYLGQDGTVGFEAKLTGVLHTAGVPEGEPGPHATEIAPGVAASVHQHFFCARLDMDVDGTRNTVVEIEGMPEPRSAHNPDGHAFSTDRRVLDRESAARRSVHSALARRWRVESGERQNRVGEPTAYELIPGEGIEALALPDSEFRRRARFLDHHLWVTPFAADERYPAGEYPNQSPGGDGLERWTKADRPLVGEDVVLWYTFGSHHIPRLEDWPVMPVVRCGFELRPVGFFDRNPALDVPPPAAHCHPR